MIGILGSTGFVGKNLINTLEKVNVPCIGGSRRNGVDARDSSTISNWIQKNNIQTIINLAAVCGGIGLNKVAPADLWLATTKISTAIMEACVNRPIKIIMIGTVCSYAKHCPTPFRESDLMHHGMPEETNLAYGISKLNALMGAQAFARQYNMNICNLIPVNMYGPHDNFSLDTSHVIPAIIRKMDDAIKHNKSDITLWGDGTPTREFLYVEDCCRAIMLAVEKLKSSELVNIGSGSEISIKDLAITIANLMGYKGGINWSTAQPNGQPRRCLDVSKADQLFGFRAKTKLADGLRKTIEWYNNSKTLIGA